METFRIECRCVVIKGGLRKFIEKHMRGAHLMRCTLRTQNRRQRALRGGKRQNVPVLLL